MIDKWIIVGGAHYAMVAVILKLLGFILPYCVTCYYSHLADFILFVYVAKITFELTKKYQLTDKLPPENRAVFITGCDTGFGHNLAKRLDSIGYPVFAGCLNPDGAGASELQKSCSKRLQILGIDVTKDDSVKKAATFVKDNLGTSELWAIVNNAGIQKGHDVELSSLDDFKDTLEVNTFGPIRVTKAFLPMLRQSRGRIVNVASIAGRYPTPLITPYTISKYATAAFSECLKQELDVWGIRVISIEPEMFRTEIMNPDSIKSKAEKMFANLDPDIRDDYGERYLKGLKSAIDLCSAASSRNIEPVINDMENAISLEYPNTIYNPCRNILTQIICYIVIRLPLWLQHCLFKLTKIITGFPLPKEALNYL